MPRIVLVVENTSRITHSLLLRPSKPFVGESAMQKYNEGNEESAIIKLGRNCSGDISLQGEVKENFTGKVTFWWS